MLHSRRPPLARKWGARFERGEGAGDSFEHTRTDKHTPRAHARTHTGEEAGFLFPEVPVVTPVQGKTSLRKEDVTSLYNSF